MFFVLEDSMEPLFFVGTVVFFTIIGSITSAFIPMAVVWWIVFGIIVFFLLALIIDDDGQGAEVYLIWACIVFLPFATGLAENSFLLPVVKMLIAHFN